MKKLLLFSSVFISATLLACGQNNEPFKTFTFASAVTSSVKTVEANTTNGRITLNGDDGSVAVVEMYVSPNRSGIFQRNWSNEDIIQTLEEDYTIEIKVEGDKLIAFAKPKNSRSQQKLSISFKISVPKQVNSNLQTSNASIQISNLEGSHEFRTSNGSVTVENVAGMIAGTSSNGSITVTNCNDVIDLKSSNGRITTKDCNGKIVLKTSNGSLNLTNLNGHITANTSNGSVTSSNIIGEMKIGTSNGSIRLDNISGNVEATTSNSSVNVAMESVSDFVVLSTSNGSLNLSLPSDIGYNVKAKGNRVETSGLRNFSGRTDNKNLDGRIGDGGPTIDVRTSGRVNISFR